MNHRQLLDGSGAFSTATKPDTMAFPGGTPDFDLIRNDFPRARTAAYFDNASSHPLSVHSAAALHRYIDWITNEMGEPW